PPGRDDSLPDGPEFRSARSAGPQEGDAEYGQYGEEYQNPSRNPPPRRARIELDHDIPSTPVSDRIRPIIEQ
ncbi:MAG TPA: hypothetical protein VH092_00555, partial [Urbifossiella sp.]|nr:hypothetical protein [Urbifossiella sp.]